MISTTPKAYLVGGGIGSLAAAAAFLIRDGGMPGANISILDAGPALGGALDGAGDTFAFQPWHSAVEFRRYLHRFVMEFSRIETLGGVKRTVLNAGGTLRAPALRPGYRC